MKKALKLFIDMLRISAMRSIAIIAIVAVIGFSMAACGGGAGGGGAGGDDGGNYPITYAVTVNGGTGSGSYAAGATVSISATASSGQTFTNWTVNSGGAVLANANSASTTFTMPANAVTVTANFTGGSSPNLSLNGAWQRKTGDSIGQVITIIDSNGFFTHVEGGWETVRSKGNITIGDKYLRNITKTGDRTWSYQIQLYDTSTFALVPFANGTLTLSADGNTFTSNTPTAQTTNNTWTRVQNDLNGAWQRKTGDSIGQVITIIDSDGFFTHVEGGWETVRSKGNITIGDKYLRNITKTGDRTWSYQIQLYDTSTFALVPFANGTLTLSADGNTFTSNTPTAQTTNNTWTRVR